MLQRAASLVLTLLAIATPALTQEKLGKARVISGPMLGAVEATRARFWMQASGEDLLEIECSRDEGFEPSQRVAAKALRANDLLVTLVVDGLEPATEYWYRVLVDGKPAPYLRGPWRFRTAPQVPAHFRVAFGSCARFEEDADQPIWTAVERARPDLFFWLGDNFYGDTLDSEVLLRVALRQRDVRNLQPLLRTVPQLATWDDHDFGINDYDRRHPAKEASLAVFRRYWANPAAGTADVPGVFFRYAYGGVDFFFIDCRYHRDPNDAPDGPQKTFLGEGQRRWLERELLASKASFKVLVSGSGWSAAKGMGGDSWASYMRERDAFFDFLIERDVRGVVLLSGDTHVGELNAIPRAEKGGYDLYDLVSSPLAQDCSTSWLHRKPEHRVREVYFQGPNFGVLDFRPGSDPELRFELHDVRGKSVWKPLVLRASDLVPGKSTAADKTWPRRG